MIPKIGIQSSLYLIFIGTSYIILLIIIILFNLYIYLFIYACDSHVFLIMRHFSVVAVYVLCLCALFFSVRSEIRNKLDF
jgi:hypothetical protein